MSDLKLRVWNSYFPYCKSAYDIYGFKISIDDFEIDHIYPKSLNGSDELENLMPISSIANKEKSYKLYGKINGRTFKVQKYKHFSNKIIGKIYVNQVMISVF